MCNERLFKGEPVEDQCLIRRILHLRQNISLSLQLMPTCPPDPYPMIYHSYKRLDDPFAGMINCDSIVTSRNVCFSNPFERYGFVCLSE